MKPSHLRSQGKAVEALLILLKHLTAHARWVFAALLALYALSGIRTVGPHEQALLLRFGKLQPQVHGPGLLIGMPDPFDRLIRFETGKEHAIALDAWAATGSKIDDPDKPVELTDAQLEQAIVESRNGGAAEAVYVTPEQATLDPVTDGYTLTSDFNVIQGRFVLRYRIDQPFLHASAGENPAAILSSLAYQAIAAEISRLPIDGSLTSGRKELASAAAARVRTEAASLRLGVRVSGIDIIELTPPSQVLAAFEDVANARQFAKTMHENSRQYREETLGKSRGEAGTIVHRAEGFAANLTGEAHGEAAAFNAMLAEYRRDPELVSRRILRETLDTVLAGVHSRTLLPSGQAVPSLVIEPSPEFSR